LAKSAFLSFPDKYLLRATITVVALSILVPGIFGVNPPQWFGPATPKELAKSAKPATPKKPIAEIAAPVESKPIAPKPIAPKSVSAPEVTQTAKIDKDVEPVPLPRMVEKIFGPGKTEKPAVKASRTTRDAGRDQKTVTRSTINEPRESSAPKSNTVPMTVARVFVKQIPSAHIDLLTPEQKDSFINFILPLILAGNEEILQRRAAIKRAADSNDRAALEKWAQLYKVTSLEQSNDDLLREILKRADVIPVALAMSQAAIESGWGTSRFAQHGNALFGQWAWDESAGLKPLEASNDRAVVRSFPNLFGSVRAYMHNLNIHPRYAEFRQERAALASQQEPGKAYLLARYLDGYAEIGFEYVEKLRAVMRVNNLDRYALAKLQ
jgi:Bax protein